MERRASGCSLPVEQALLVRRARHGARARFVAPLLLLLLTAAVAVDAQRPPYTALVTAARGTVNVRRSGGAGFVAAPVKTQLAPGDIVQTGAASRAVLLFSDGSQVKLNAGTLLLIPATAGRPRLERGELFARTSAGRRTGFQTQTAVAGIRGTELNLRVEEDGTTTLTVVEGEVDFSNEQGAVLVAASQQSVARPGQAPTPPVVVDPSGIIAWEATVESLSFSIETPLTPAGDGLERLLQQRERTVAFTPGDAGAFLALGDVRQDLGRFREAEAAYDRALALQPSLVTAQANRAQLALREGELERAETDYARLAAAYPASPEGPLGLGMTQLAMGNVERATPFLEAAAKLDPQGPRPPTFRGVAKLRRADVAGAEELFRQALARDAQFYPAHAYLSYALTLKGEVPQAETAARRAVALAPHSGLAREALANALFYAGQPEAASAEVARALEANPLSSSARLTQAKILVATDRIEEGVQAAQQAVALDPRNPVAHTTLGVMLLAQNDPRRAEREFRQALALSPNLSSAQSGLGAVFAQRGQLAQALAQQKAALALDGSSAGAHNNLGAVYLAQGKLDAAIAEFRQAIALQPGWGLPHANLAQAYLELNRFAEAVSEGEAAVRLGEDSAVLRTTLARVYARQRRFDRALSELRQAEALDPDYPQAQFQLSRLFLEQQRDRDALRAILRGTSVQPGAMVENRLYARTEATLAGGNLDARQIEGKTDGRALDARLSYFTSATRSQTDNDRDDNGDQRQSFALGLFGYEQSPAQQWLFYGSRIDRKSGRPGRELDGGAEDPNFRSEFDGWETHLLHRLATGLRSSLTLKVGTRTSDLVDRNPDSLLPDPATAVDKKPYRRLNSRVEETLAEARWDGRLSQKDRLTLGTAWRDEDRSLNGLVGVVEPTPAGPVFRHDPTRVRQEVAFRTFYGEWLHRASDRLDLKLGGYLGRASGAESIALPKFVARYRPSGRSYLVFLAYPTFRSEVTELSPVEAWAQPFGFDRLGLTEDGSVMSHELHYERPFGGLSLLSLSAFTRNAHGFLLDLENPRFAPAPSRLLVERGRIEGAQAAFEHVLGRNLSARIFARFQQTEDRSTGNDLPYFPEWLSGVRLDYLDRAGWRSFLSLTYVGKRYADRENERRLSGFPLLDFRIARQLNLHQNLFLQINNLLDRDYEQFEGYPEPGRTILGGIEYRF